MVLALAFAIGGIASMAVAVVHPPDVDPANFVGCPVQTNPYFPLVPGSIWEYEGTSDGTSTSNTVEVTCDTKPIQLENGVVTAIIVHDQAFEGPNNTLVEDTFDYFATDCDGNVWYFGEDSTELPSGSKEGSWQAGVDDADAGFIMLASPQEGDRYYQEFARGVAEDQAKVVSLDGSACTPETGCVGDLLVTKETSRFDPGVVEYKYYLSGIGFIRSDIVKGGDESSALTSYTQGTGVCP